MRTMNDFLRQKRLDSGLSQLDVAQELGYSSPQFVSNWERGLVSPPLETISVLIDLYKIAPSEVIDRILDETREHLEANLAKRGGKKRKAAKRR
jgi:transcriptional regulator with XRE-family HTH domain